MIVRNGTRRTSAADHTRESREPRSPRPWPFFSWALLPCPVRTTPFFSSVTPTACQVTGALCAIRAYLARPSRRPRSWLTTPLARAPYAARGALFIRYVYPLPARQQPGALFRGEHP